jgi:hypothetical protein
LVVAVTFGGVSAGQITQWVNDTRYTVYNFTNPGHIFHPGYVAGAVVNDGEYLGVMTIGEGVGSYEEFNTFIAHPAWVLQDLYIRPHVRTSAFLVPTLEAACMVNWAYLIGMLCLLMITPSVGGSIGPLPGSTPETTLEVHVGNAENDRKEVGQFFAAFAEQEGLALLDGSYAMPRMGPVLSITLSGRGVYISATDIGTPGTMVVSLYEITPGGDYVIIEEKLRAALAQAWTSFKDYEGM